MLPAWVSQLESLPGFQAALTPLAEPEFITAFTTRLRAQKKPPARDSALRSFLKKLLG